MAIAGLPAATSIYGTGAVNPFAATQVPNAAQYSQPAVNPYSSPTGPTGIGVPANNQPHIEMPKVTIAGSIPKMTAPPAPAPPSALDKWLAGDTTYQEQLAEFNKSKSDEQTDYNRQSQVINRDYNQTQRQLNVQAQRDRMDQQNDFAGRGILHSGVYAKALGDYNTDLNTKIQNLLTGRNDQLGDLASQRNSFLQELQLQLNAAKQDAIRRRAQSLGL